MIIYATPKTMARYNIKSPSELSSANVPRAKSILARDSGDALREWGLDFFDFVGRNCLVTMNYATKFVLFLFDVKQEHIQSFGGIMAYFLLELYSGDHEMTQSLHRMFEADKCLVFSPARRRSLVSQFDARIRGFVTDSAPLYEYIDYKNVLHTRQINYDINFNSQCTYTINGRKTSRDPGGYFRELILSRYGQEAPSSIPDPYL